jgi:hypothetical protein
MLRRNVDRLDHVCLLVRRENFDRYMQLMSDALGVVWDEVVPNEGTGIIAVPSWDCGVELIAPLDPQGSVGRLVQDRIDRFGEGSVTLVWGVADMETAVSRATAHGGEHLFDVKMNDEPWLRRFESFREAKVRIFPDDFSSTVTFGEIVPRET